MKIVLVIGISALPFWGVKFHRAHLDETYNHVSFAVQRSRSPLDLRCRRTNCVSSSLSICNTLTIGQEIKGTPALPDLSTCVVRDSLKFPISSYFTFITGRLELDMIRYDSPSFCMVCVLKVKRYTSGYTNLQNIRLRILFIFYEWSKCRVFILWTEWIMFFVDDPKKLNLFIP